MSIEIELAIIGATVSIAASYVSKFASDKYKKNKDTLDDRINKLTSALRDSSHLVTQIESEVQARQKLVMELKEDAKRYEQLITLNQEQVDAVAQVLQGELKKESKSSFWKGVAVNFVFFLLGAGASWYLSSGL